MDKITKREMFTAMVKGLETGDFLYDKDDIIEFCNKEIAALDRKAAKAKERAASKAAEVDALAIEVANVLTTDEFKPIADIAAVVAKSNPDATVSKVTYRLTQLVKNGEAEKQEITVPGVDGGKSRKVQGYRKFA